MAVTQLPSARQSTRSQNSVHTHIQTPATDNTDLVPRELHIPSTPTQRIVYYTCPTVLLADYATESQLNEWNGWQGLDASKKNSNNNVLKPFVSCSFLQIAATVRRTPFQPKTAAYAWRPDAIAMAISNLTRKSNGSVEMEVFRLLLDLGSLQQ